MEKKGIEILDEGSGQIFSKITPNEFREHMREKAKNAWRDKRMDIKTAIEQFVHDGDYLTMGGVSFVRLSMAGVHEIIRQKKRNLNLAAGTRTYDFNMLLDAGCVKNIDCGYITGMEVFGIPYVTRKRAEKMIASGEMGISEYDNASMAWRHKAAAMGLPFLPIRNMMGADGFKHSAAKKIRCPFTGEEIVLVPAIYADVCIIHVHRCDIYGNCQIEGALNEDLGKSKSAKRLIITTENIIDTEEIRLSPDRTLIPCFYVDAVVEVPYGGHPNNMPGMYYVDIDHMKEYINAAKDPSGKDLEKYYEKYIYGVENFNQYLEIIGGKERLKYLEDLEHLRGKNINDMRGFMKKGDYNIIELMAIVAAREIEDRAIIYIGTGIPMLAASLAQNMHAPNIVPVFEAGGIAPQMPTLPLSVGCSRTTYRAIRTCDMPEIFEMAQLGIGHYAFLGGAQIDKYGNLNSTVKGQYDAPKVRWPGSGGANAFGSLCWRTMIIMNHEKRRFVEKVDFITTPGYIDGPGARERAGLPPGTGPYRVFTDKALLDFEEKTKRMRLIGLLPGVTLDEVIENTGFELLIKEDLKSVPPPTEEELSVLREKVDPHRIVLSRGDKEV